MPSTHSHKHTNIINNNNNALPFYSSLPSRPFSQTYRECARKNNNNIFYMHDRCVLNILNTYTLNLFSQWMAINKLDYVVAVNFLDFLLFFQLIRRRQRQFLMETKDMGRKFLPVIAMLAHYVCMRDWKERFAMSCVDNGLFYNALTHTHTRSIIVRAHRSI